MTSEQAREKAAALGHHMGVWIDDPDSALRAYSSYCACGAHLTNADAIGWESSTALMGRCPQEGQHEGDPMSNEEAWGLGL